MTKEPKASNFNNELIMYRLDEIKFGQEKFVTKEENLALKIEIQALREEIQAIKKNRNLIGWLYPSMSAGFSSLLTYLIIEYFILKK